MSIPAVIFDMDGVLVDSEPVITEAAIRALRLYGVEAHPADFLPFTGTGEDRFIGGVAKKHGIVYQTEMKTETYRIYQEIVRDAIEVYPGTLPLLQELNTHQIPCALASSADLVKVKANLLAAQIPLDTFQVLLSGDDVVNKKPAPDIYQLAAQRLGVRPWNCVVIEDALSGIAAAHAAGIRCIAVMTSFPKEELLQHGADWVCQDIGDVWATLQTIPCDR